MESTTIGIIIASHGRANELAKWKGYISSQSVKPEKFFISIVAPSDLPEPGELPENSIVFFSDIGSSRQRNAGIDSIASSVDLLAFFDDDYVPSPDCLSDIKDFFDRHPDVVGATGLILMDGVNSSAISDSEAAKVISNHKKKFSNRDIVCDLRGLYGCNMVVRSCSVQNIRFDERLPLYGWQEDFDFAFWIGKKGRLVKTEAFFGVHLGVKSGRTSGVRLGYSQIANPVFLLRKGSMDLWTVLKLILKNFISNHIRSLKPEPWIDRRGRVRGNWIGITDLIKFKCNPKNIIKL